MKRPIEFYFGDTEWESQNSDKYSSEWNKVKKELDSIKSIWQNNTTKDFPNLRFIIGDNFKNYQSRFKSYTEPKGKYPIQNNWIHKNLGNGNKKIFRPILIGNRGLFVNEFTGVRGKLCEWDIICQDKYSDNTIFMTSSWIRKRFKSYGYIRDQAKINSWKAYQDNVYSKQFIYHIFGHIIKLRDMKSCSIMNKHKCNWQLGSSKTQYMEGLDTETTLDKRLSFYIKRKFK